MELDEGSSMFTLLAQAFDQPVDEGSNVSEEMLCKQTCGKSVKDLLPESSSMTTLSSKKLHRARPKGYNDCREADNMISDCDGRKRYSINDDIDDYSVEGSKRRSQPLGDPKDLQALSENLLGELPSQVELDNYLTSPCSQRNTFESRMSEGRRSTKGSCGRFTGRSSYGRVSLRSNRQTLNRDREERRTWEPEESAEILEPGKRDYGVVVVGAANILRGVQSNSKLGPEDIETSRDVCENDAHLLTELEPIEYSSRSANNMTTAGSSPSRSPRSRNRGINRIVDEDFQDTREGASGSEQQSLVESPNEPISTVQARCPRSRLLRSMGSVDASGSAFRLADNDVMRPLEPPTRVPTDELMSVERGTTTESVHSVSSCMQSSEMWSP